MVPPRAFSRNVAILNTSDAVYPAFTDYKFEKVAAGGRLMARILIGFVATHPSNFQAYEYIMPMPWHLGSGAQFDHMRAVVALAAACFPDLEFATQGSPLVKTRATASQVGDKRGRDARIESYEDRYKALAIADGSPSLQGTRVLVIDDVFTTGTTLNAAAHKLKDAGASDVCGLSFFRFKSHGASNASD
jgi:predicted amidophosphoribosyltransferase